MRQRILDRDRAISTKCWTALRCLFMTVALLTRQVHELDVAGGAPDDGADCRAFQPDEEIAFPVP